MTGQILQFPDLMSRDIWVNPYEEEALSPPLLGLPRMQVFDRTFEANLDFLGLADFDVTDFVEFYTDDRHPAKILVDVDDMPHRDNLRGLYYVDLNTFKLISISDEPLVHFT